MEPGKIIFIDTEIDSKSKKILDIGAITGDGREFHGGSLSAFSNFLCGCKYICGHNILKHDLKHLHEEVSSSDAEYFIDTLYLSPLLFPKKPYHRLVKDDKLTVDELNNPLNDAKKARDLFYDEHDEYNSMDAQLQGIYSGLLSGALALVPNAEVAVQCTRPFVHFCYTVGAEEKAQQMSQYVNFLESSRGAV